MGSNVKRPKSHSENRIQNFEEIVLIVRYSHPCCWKMMEDCIMLWHIFPWRRLLQLDCIAAFSQIDERSYKIYRSVFLNLKTHEFFLTLGNDCHINSLLCFLSFYSQTDMPWHSRCWDVTNNQPKCYFYSNFQNISEKPLLGAWVGRVLKWCVYVVKTPTQYPEFKIV